MPDQASPSVVALQGQFSASPCRVMGGPRGELRGSAVVGLMVLGRALVAATHGPVSTRTPTRTRQSRATGQRVAGAGLRTGLTGRWDRGAGYPGFHPGLVDLALQAGIAEVLPQYPKHRNPGPLGCHHAAHTAFAGFAPNVRCSTGANQMITMPTA
jgi:hypothetical protein